MIQPEEWRETGEGPLWSGIQDGALGPCLVLGIAGWASARMDALPTAPGLFRYSHQTAGLGCNHHDVVGAFLPLATCKAPRIASALEEILGVFDGDYTEALLGPSLAQISRVSALLERAGLSCERTFRQTEEAYVAFDFDERSYAWIAQHFQMVTRLRESTHDRSEVLKTAPLRWPTKQALMEALMGGATQVVGSGLLLFENSD